jgi:DNA polymerase III subunit epsilon
VHNPLYGRTIAFTGELSLPRREAQQLLVDIGGSVAIGVSKKVGLLVTGYQDMTGLAAGHARSGKYLRAEESVIQVGH